MGDDRACHRATVADLVLRSAGKRGKKITVMEWPGGTAQEFEIETSDAEYKKLINGKRSIELGPKLPSVDLLSAPWGSTASVCSGKDRAWAVIGPAKYGQGRWYLPLPRELGSAATDTRAPQVRVAEWRRTLGLEGRLSGK